MRRGRKPKPVGLRVLQGNPRDHALPNEPDYPAGWPTMPEWLSAGGREVWRYVMGQMQAAGVVRLIDRDLLAAYCDAVDCAIDASKKARADARWNAERRHSWTLARLLGALFGIGPAERGRVAPDDGPRGHSKTRFFA